MNKNPENDRGVLTAEAQRVTVIDGAVEKVEIALQATGYTVAEQAPVASANPVMQEAVELTTIQNEVGQDGFALTA